MTHFRYLIIWVFIFSLSAQANPTSTASKSSPSTLPKIVTAFVDHADDGCPTNSYCSPFGGNERKKWMNFMEKLSGSRNTRTQKLEEFRKKTGIPLTAWVTPEKQKEKEIISWDSRCLHHQKEGNIFFPAEVLAPNLNTLKDKKLVIDQTYTILKDNIVRTYMTPREEYPLYIDGDDLVFLREEEGNYYALKMSPAGLNEIIEAAKLDTEDYPTEIKCPEALINFAKEREKEKKRNLYLATPFCKQIKNIRSKESQIFLFNKSCN